VTDGRQDTLGANPAPATAEYRAGHGFRMPQWLHKRANVIKDEYPTAFSAAAD
jgi:hypothetical protein